MREMYVHGYGPREHNRLMDQAAALVDLLHGDTAYPAGSRVLEVGCGIGAQTVTLAGRSPEAHFTSLDISRDSLAQARIRTQRAGITNVQFEQADVFALPHPSQSFDHIFVCFLLEHLARPLEAMIAVRDLLRPGGTITVIEGDHGSAYFHPTSRHAQDAIQSLITLQGAAGDALIGRRLYPLMRNAGFGDVHVKPLMVYVDASRPDLVDAFTRKTFIAMIEGARDGATKSGLITAEDFDAGIADLHRTTEADGVFCYTFFKGVGTAQQPSS